jgi:glutathione S-transferase
MVLHRLGTEHCLLPIRAAQQHPKFVRRFPLPRLQVLCGLVGGMDDKYGPDVFPPDGRNMILVYHPDQISSPWERNGCYHSTTVGTRTTYRTLIMAATNGASTPEITLYTNHGCPWAHRAHITIKELGLPYKEEIIDLDRPRDPWYLKINPVSNLPAFQSLRTDVPAQRGLVPSIKYNGEIITESAVVSQFLADAHQSHLLPPSTGAANALFRARVNFFADTFITKALSAQFGIYRAQTEAEKDAVTEDLVNVLVKEMEPLFTWDTSKGPFFEGSERLTLAEVSYLHYIGGNSWILICVPL